MNILCRYIFKEYLRVYLLTATTLLSVFIIVSLFEILADALEHKAGPALLGKYLLMKVPQAAYFMAPLIVLISSILCLGMLSKSNEIVAMRAAGLGISSITAPIFFIATLSSFFMLVMGELVLPYANIEMKRVHKEEIKKQVRPGVQQKNNFWYRTDSGSILKIDVVSETGKILRNVTLLSFKENRLWQRIESKNVVWEDSKWKAEESWFRFFDKEGSFISEFHQAIELPLGEQPSDFTVIRKSPDKMSYQEIGDYIKRIKKEGMDPTKYVVDMKAKISFPFICVVMALISIPFSLRSDRQGGITLGISIGATTGFVAWFTYSIGLSLGRSGKIPPFWSVWGAEILFIILGFSMIFSSRR